MNASFNSLKNILLITPEDYASRKIFEINSRGLRGLIGRASSCRREPWV